MKDSSKRAVVWPLYCVGSLLYLLTLSGVCSRWWEPIPPWPHPNGGFEAWGWVLADAVIAAIFFISSASGQYKDSSKIRSLLPPFFIGFAFALAGIAGPIAYHCAETFLAQEKYGDEVWLARAAALLAWVAAGAAAFVFTAAVEYFSISALGARAPRRNLFDRLEFVVLLLGIAAGLSVGIFVGVDASEKLTDAPQPTITKTQQSGEAYRAHHFITRVIGPGAIAGLIVAILVAVGSIVLIFEKKIASFLDEVQDSTASVLATKKEIETLRPDVVDSLKSLQELAHVLIGLKERVPSADAGLVSAEARYLGAWLNWMKKLDGSDAGAALTAIAESYWQEEAYDVTRLKLVTNPRNYTAFLVAAVNALEERNKKKGARIHFYTVTPVGPQSIVNWPEKDVLPGSATEVHARRGAHNISTYMLFIRNAVSRGQIVHRRWIWTTTNDSVPRKFRGFGNWPYYENDEHRYGAYEETCPNPLVLGCPLSYEDITAVFGVQFLERGTFEIHNHRLQDPSGWEEWKQHFKDRIRVQPLLKNDTDTAAVVPKLKALCSTLSKQLCLDMQKLLQLSEDYKPSDGGTVALSVGDRELLRNIEAWVCGMDGGQGSPSTTSSDDPRAADKILLLLQRVNSFLAAAGRITRSDDEHVWAKNDEGIDLDLTEFEDKLVRRKWMELLLEELDPQGGDKQPLHAALWRDHNDKPRLPTFEEYFDHAFHSDRKPHFQLLDLLEEDVKVNGVVVKAHDLFEKTGPEFALLATDCTDGPVEYRLTVGREKLQVLMASRSTMSSPWKSCEIELILSGVEYSKKDNTLKNFVDAMQTLIDKAKDL